MKIKFEITQELIHKFNILMQNQLGLPIKKVCIKDIGSQYQFQFTPQNDSGYWHFELDKSPFEGGECYTLHCSNIRMNTPLDCIKDLKMFCAQIAKVKEMQTEYINQR